MTENRNSGSSICLDALIGELTFSTLMHDLRGELGVVQGWVEVAVLDGQLNSPQLDRGLLALADIILAASEASASRFQVLPVSAETLLDGLPATGLTTAGTRVLVCVERFREAITLAAPESIQLQSPGSADRVVMEVSGLSEEGVRQASCPSVGFLAGLRTSRSDDRTLGAALLRAVVGTAGGHLRVTGLDKIELHFKGEHD